MRKTLLGGSLVLATACFGGVRESVPALVPTADSTRYHALIARANALLARRPDSAFIVCTEALAIAQDIGDPALVGEAEGWLGYLAEQRGDLEAAVAHNERSMAAAQQVGDKKGVATLLNNLAAIRKDQGRVEESLALHQQSLTINRSIGDSSGVATSLNNIGLILQDQGRLSEALDNYDRALKLYEGAGDSDGIGTVLHNIASVFREQEQFDQALIHLARAFSIYDGTGDRYSAAYTLDALGGVMEGLERLEDAQRHYRRSLELRMETGDIRGQGYSHLRLGDMHLTSSTPKEALGEFQLALDLFTASDDKRGRSTALLGMARAQDRIGDTEAALRHGNESLELARELGHAALQRDAAGMLATFHRKAGRWKDALLMNDLHIAMRDSVRSEENRRRSIRQEFQYAYGLKEAALTAEQERKDLVAREGIHKEKNRRNMFLFFGIGVLAIAIGLWSRLRYVRRSRTLIQKEKDRSEGLLLNILPAAVAEELKDTGEAQARSIDQVTVLFTDFKGFTEMSEKLSPKELVRDLHDCFSAFDAICERHGIEKIKTIGDAYMAAGGIPVPNDTHAADVVHAALEMRDFIAEGKARKIAAGQPFFEIRIGIHTGPVVAGIVGVKKFQYDIWGDTVNTASRMESSGEVGKVNISEATYALVKDVGKVNGEWSMANGGSTHSSTSMHHSPAFVFTPRGKVQAKGKGELEMYFVARA